MELPSGTILFHAGQAGFSFDNRKTLWTATNRNKVLTYKGFDGQKYPKRLIYELRTLRPIRLAEFPPFGNEFCLRFCSADHSIYARQLTEWGSARASLDGSSPLDGIKDGWETLVFRAGEVLDIKSIYCS